MRIISGAVPGVSRLARLQELSKKARQRLKWFDYYHSHTHQARLTCRYPELRRAWVLKESFRDWYRGTNRSRAEERPELLEKRIANDYLPEFKELLHTLTNWREEILNYFDYPITNGFVEGKNNCIKTMKRMAYPSREGPEHG